MGTGWLIVASTVESDVNCLARSTALPPDFGIISFSEISGVKRDSQFGLMRLASNQNDLLPLAEERILFLMRVLRFSFKCEMIRE